MSFRHLQCNTHEFDDIIDFDVIESYKNLQQLRKQYQEVKAARPIDAGYERAAKAILEAVQTQNPYEELQRILGRFVRLSTPPVMPDSRSETLTCAIQLILAFSEFRTHEFKAFIDQCCPATGTLSDWEERLEELDSGIKELSFDLRSCVNVPQERGFTPEEECAWAEQRVQQFIEKWKARAKLFTEPVSVYGRSLRSIRDSELRSMWWGAYQQLELTPAKASTYIATREPAPPPSALQQIVETV